jgi:two-component system, NarL family, sensor kinase
MEGSVDVFVFLFVGMLTLVLLAGAVVLFFFFYQKKVLRQQLQMSELQTAHREELLHSNIEQVESERYRIATDLHDELGSIFSTLKLKINQLEQHPNPALLISESREIIDSGIGSVRRISHAITPPGLEMFGLPDALTSLLEKSNTPQTRTALYCPESFPRLDAKIELSLYRIAQELLNNSIRHAEASEITVHLSCTEEQVHFEYADNGRGFDPVSLQQRRGLGLRGIEARANYLNAGIDWQSAPGEGFTVRIQMPRPVPG